MADLSVLIPARLFRNGQSATAVVMPTRSSAVHLSVFLGLGSVQSRVLSQAIAGATISPPSPRWWQEMPMNAVRATGALGDNGRTAQDVIPRRDQFKVCRIAAERVSTEVVKTDFPAGLRTARNGPDEPRIEHAMNPFHTTAKPAQAVRRINLAVRSCPFPAASRVVHRDALKQPLDHLQRQSVDGELHASFYYGMRH